MQPFRALNAVGWQSPSLGRHCSLVQMYPMGYISGHRRKDSNTNYSSFFRPPPPGHHHHRACPNEPPGAHLAPSSTRPPSSTRACPNEHCGAHLKPVFEDRFGISSPAPPRRCSPLPPWSSSSTRACPNAEDRSYLKLAPAYHLSPPFFTAFLSTPPKTHRLRGRTRRYLDVGRGKA